MTAKDMTGTTAMSAAVQEAAYWEAQGLGVAAAAEKVGLTRATISWHRNHNEKYQELVRQHCAESLSELTIDILAVRRKATTAVNAAIDVLLDHMKAEFDGQPLYKTQSEAVSILINSPVIRGLFQQVEKMEEGAKQAPQAAVTLIIKSQNGEEITIEDAEFTEAPADE